MTMSMSSTPHPAEPTADLLSLTVNGEPRSLPRGSSVGALVRHLGLTSATVAVERNGDVVPRREHDTTPLAEGDTLEVVTFVGGG